MELDCPEATPVVAAPSFSLYLFYDHSGFLTSEWSYALYKIEIDSTATTSHTEVPPEELSPILKLPIKEYPSGMRCARLGSKLYFLGGSKREDGRFLEWRRRETEGVCHSRDVYTFDLLTGVFAKMDARLNAGKPTPCLVFAANGKLYALGRIPHCPDIPLSEMSKMSLFECFDPATNEWRVLDALPPLDIGRDLFVGKSRRGIDWIGCTVFQKLQQVVCIGREFSQSCDSCKVFKFVYDLKEGKWTSHTLRSDANRGWLIRSTQEACDKDYVYGLPTWLGRPVKIKSDYVNRPDNDYDGGVVRMSIPPHVSEQEQQVNDLFGERFHYSNVCFTRLLRYVGNGHFCYIVSGMLYDPDSPYFYDSDYEDPHDEYTRGITIALFKEEEKKCFQARILHSKSYTICTPFINDGELEGCFVVNLKQLRKKKDKKDKKKKNVLAYSV